jgi:hypothetical protein
MLERLKMNLKSPAPGYILAGIADEDPWHSRHLLRSGRTHLPEELMKPKCLRGKKKVTGWPRYCQALFEAGTLRDVHASV